MILTWAVVALASFLLAALLAAVDGALLASGHSTWRGTLSDPERAHRALSSSRLVTHLVTGASVALSLGTYMDQPLIAVTVTTAILALHVALVEGVARAAGYGAGPAALARFAPSAFVVDLMFRPVTAAGGAVEAALRRVLPPRDNTSVPTAARTGEFRVVADSQVSPAEAELLHGVFSLGDTQVQEIMVPRVDVVAIEHGTPWSELLDRVRSSEHSRFPVVDETLDSVLGILYAKDLLPAVVKDDEPESWSRLIQPATFVPATKTIDRQLRDFKTSRTHIAMVMDEYGGTLGLLTIEDILEEIVGEIRDEFDVEEPPTLQDGRDRFWVSGTLSLSDLSELVGSEFQSDDLTTVGGLVYKAFGRVPRAGESRRIDGFRVVVERVRRRRIERVYLERVIPEGE